MRQRIEFDMAMAHFDRAMIGYGLENYEWMTRFTAEGPRSLVAVHTKELGENGGALALEDEAALERAMKKTWKTPKDDLSAIPVFDEDVLKTTWPLEIHYGKGATSYFRVSDITMPESDEGKAVASACRTLIWLVASMNETSVHMEAPKVCHRTGMVYSYSTVGLSRVCSFTRGVLTSRGKRSNIW